jgi:hypothetical protein
MSSADVDRAHAPDGNPADPGFWQRIKTAIVHTERKLAFVQGVTVVSILGTLIGAYFQNISAYEAKVATQAKEDLTAATAAFAAASNALSTAITLQGLLFYDFAHAAKLSAVGDDNALTSKNARKLYKSYEDASAALLENVNLLARTMEIYLDWPSDPAHDPATNNALDADPITASLLGAVDFDCDQDMPSFDPGKSTITKEKNGKTLTVDWYSAKHHVFTIEYCFGVTQKTWMEIVRQWASQSSLDQSGIAKFFSDGTADKLQERLDSEVVRLNAYMSRAMNEIDQIRVKYRPNGYLCSVPIASRLMGQRCTPLRVRS